MPPPARLIPALWLAALAVCIFPGAGVERAAAEPPLALSIVDASYLSGDATARTNAFTRSVTAGADSVTILAVWRSIATAEPTDPSDPTDPAYNWARLDAAVREAAASGLKVQLLLNSAPDFAEGSGRPAPSLARPGTWKPSPSALGEFATALAGRFSGSFDPGGGSLPAVRVFHLWAEPNLATYLTPQFEDGESFAPGQYRRMLNAFYAGIKSAQQTARVVAGGTAPYGDTTHSRFSRTQPALWWRTMLCLKEGARGARLQTTSCPDPARFDIAAHHPINIGAPARHALNHDDISTPDIGKLARILSRAKQTGRALPKRNKPIWATEIWWDSKPPDPNGLPLAKHARYLEEALSVLWRQGVSQVSWFQISDPDTTAFSTTQQSGLFNLAGTAKPALRAYRFPFVADRKGRRRIGLWLRAPAPGRVILEQLRDGDWRQLRSFQVGPSRILATSLKTSKNPTLRVSSAGETSLPDQP